MNEQAIFMYAYNMMFYDTKVAIGFITLFYHAAQSTNSIHYNN